MIDKQVSSVDAALSDIRDDSCVMIGGFGDSGVPESLVEGLIRNGARNLTVISNNAGSGERGVAALFREGRIRKIMCSYPRSRGSHWFEYRFEHGEVELEIVPQGTLSERIRAGGSGIAGFYTATGVGTQLASGKEVRQIDGREYLLETPLKSDFALIRGQVADRWGNTVFDGAARNYNPSMAMAAVVTIAEVDEVAELGALHPEVIVTPGIFVQRVVVSRSVLASATAGAAS